MDESEENKILYDLTVQAEWRQEPEIVSRFLKDKGNYSKSSTWSLLYPVSFSQGRQGYLSTNLCKLINAQINWKVALSKNGEFLAILQDSSIEVRSSQNEFTTVVAKWNLLVKDPFPQWRCLAWSCDAYMISVSDSSGQIVIYSMAGQRLCSIPSTRATAGDLSQALCSLVFKDLRAVNVSEDQHWFTELLAINYQGDLTGYVISQEGDFRPNHVFSFSEVYPSGVSSVVYLESHSILIVGGGAQPEHKSDTPLKHGISVWRVLSGSPYYKLVIDYETELININKKHQLVKRLRIGWFWSGQTSSLDQVFKMNLSPSGKLLVSVHTSSMICIWDVPSLRLRQSWNLEMQPDYNVLNAEIVDNPKRRKAMKDHLTAFHLSDIGWWSDEAVILARGTGSVSVSSVQTLRNQLGDSPEWFEPDPLVTWVSEGSFLGLECERKYGLLKRHLVNENENDTRQDENYEDTDDELDMTLGLKMSRYVMQGIHYVTDIESFQPPKKRPKLVTKTYRLMCLKSTTPEELYARKIDNEEYGEALALAKNFQLDCDLVYQRQWRKSPVSVASIQDYLSKINKRAWVLHECLERVPEDFDAMHELIQYGLRGTDVEALVAIGNRTDQGRFILCQSRDNYYRSLDDYMDVDDSLEEEQERQRQNYKTLLSQVDFSMLTIEQQELCRVRQKLLQYSDRLETYQEILGGQHLASEKYDGNFFERFRMQNIVELAVEYARVGDAVALNHIFTYHGYDIMPHWLVILNNFPETYGPKEYHELLPGINENPVDGNDVTEWRVEKWREPDWCEQPQCSTLTKDQDLGAFLYEERPEYRIFRGEHRLTHDQLTKWYAYRACEIENLSGQVDSALQLVSYGIKFGVQGLTKLHDDLMTMETLVYECHIDESFTFQHLQEMSAIEKVRLMMKQSSEEMYIKNVRKLLLPFLCKCEESSAGSFNQLMREYLVTMSTKDLTLSSLVFKESKIDNHQPIISDQKQLLALALECVYSYKGNDQLDKANTIFRCLPHKSHVNNCSSNDLIELFEQVASLENHILGAEILEQNAAPQLISFIRDTQNDVSEATKLFTRLARVASRQQPALGESKLKKLLFDLCELRQKVYRCVDKSLCYEIFIESLLCSGQTDNITLAGRMMTCRATGSPIERSTTLDTDVLQFKISYDCSVNQALKAAREYFDSSATLKDPDMNYAKYCLELIADKPISIQEELNLIEGISMLEVFGVNMLPVQVRMCTDRLQLVKKAIDMKVSTYKNIQWLLKLGRLLRVGGGSEIEMLGQVLCLIAQASLKVNDYKTCYEACMRLMAVGYSEVWKECQALAEVDDFHDVNAKVELLSFAMIHCSTDMLEPIIRAKCLLQTQVLGDLIQIRVGDGTDQSPARTAEPISVKSALAQTKDILASTNRATKSVLQHISDKQWWKKTLTGLGPNKRIKPHFGVDDFDDMNAGFLKQSCHPFYESLYDVCYSNKSEADYFGICPPLTELAGLHLTECMLRMAKLEELVTAGDNNNLTSELILQLAEDIIIQDCTLGLSYLLALPNVFDADKCFDKLPKTAVSLQLAVYYYAIQIANWLSTSNRLIMDDKFTFEPQILVQKIIDYVKEMIQSDCPDLQLMASRLFHYHELLLDYFQAKTLERLNRGVNLSRFLSDEGYKEETILGLALSLDNELYSTAVSLAKRYKLELSTVYLAHLEYLFEEEELTTDQIQSRVNQLGILPELLKNGAKFSAEMQSKVFPLINGIDHGRLLLYYQLLIDCPSSTGHISPQTHIKQLRKIKSLAPGLNYKHLIDGCHEPLDVIQPILNQENVPTIAKLSSNIRDKDGRPLTSSSIYRVLSTKIFWDGQSGKKNPDNPSDWIHRYELCSDNIQKMAASDLINFVHSITFTSNAIAQLPVDCRRQILRRTLKYSKQQQSGLKKKTQAVSGTDISWDDVTSEMQRLLEHLDRLNNKVVQELTNSSDPILQKYVALFDRSCSNPAQVKSLLVQMIFEGQKLELVEDMRLVFAADDVDCHKIVIHALTELFEMIKTNECSSTYPFLVGHDFLDVLQRVLSLIAQHQRDGGTLLNSEDVLFVVRPFTSSSDVDGKTRLAILKIVEELFNPSEEDSDLILHSQTMAIISMTRSNIQVTKDDVKTEEQRRSLFGCLLDACNTNEQFLVLAELLKVWPAMKSDEDSDLSCDPWCKLVEKMFASSSFDSIIPQFLQLMSAQHQENRFSSKCTRYIFKSLLNRHPTRQIAAAKWILYSFHTELYIDAIIILGTLTKNTEDPELFTLLLQRNLVPHAVGLALYPKLIDFILTGQSECLDDRDTSNDMQVNSIVSQLLEAGHQAEAGSLLMMYRSTHRSLSVFDAAFSVISRLIKK